MIKTHKIKLYPNATMRKELEKLFDYRRFVWNQGLEIWNDMYDASLVMMDKSIRPNERKVRDELVANKADWQFERSARVLQLAVNDLSKAWANYLNPKMPNHDKPKWKSKKRSRKTFKTDRAQIVNGKLRLDQPRGTSKWLNRHDGKVKSSRFASFKTQMATMHRCLLKPQSWLKNEPFAGLLPLTSMWASSTTKPHQVMPFSQHYPLLYQHFTLVSLTIKNN